MKTFMQEMYEAWMVTQPKNPHTNGSIRWNLWEQLQSRQRDVKNNLADIERANNSLTENNEKIKELEDALETLGPEPVKKEQKDD